MSCEKCGETDWFVQYEPETGFVDIPCPWCVGVDGEMPDAIADLHDGLTQAEIETEAYPFLPRRAEAIGLEEDMAWAQHGPAW